MGTALGKTYIEILNLSLEVVARVKNLYPIDNRGNVLRYSKELSDYGKCVFRVSTGDPLLEEVGDFLIPHQYHVRVMRDSVVAWAGVIVNNTSRNKSYIEVEAYEYEFYLDKVLIRRDAETTAGDGRNNYRVFNSGTMAAAISSILTSAVSDFGGGHPMASLTQGTIENPDYPSGFKDANGSPLTGAWTFTDFVSLQFDYHTVYYVLKAFGIYTSADFELDENLVFNFQKFLGNKNNRTVFSYGAQGNIVDYNAPRLGKRMINDLWGIAADTDGKVLHANQRDETSIQTYGLLQDSAAYSDVKDLNFLKSRMNEELGFLKTFNDSPINILLNEKAYPFSQYDIGDIVTVRIKDHVIDYTQPRRIVGITVTLHNTGRELITVQTNAPREKDMGA